MTKKLKRQSLKFFGAGTLLLSLLIASDKLFMSISFAGAVAMSLLYVLRRRWPSVILAIYWFGATLVATVLAAAYLTLINLTGTTNIVSGSVVGSYGFAQGLKAVVLGGVYALVGILTNFGANPAIDSKLLRELLTQLKQGLQTVSAFSFILNGLVLAGGLVVSCRLLWESLLAKPRKTTAARKTGSALALMMLLSAAAAVGVFIVSKHTYAVDARYLSLVMLAVFVAAASFGSKLFWNGRWLLAAGGLLLISIIVSLPAAAQLSHTQSKAQQLIIDRNKLVIGALGRQPLDTLLGDYWRVVPIKVGTGRHLNIIPLSGCGQPSTTLTSQYWQSDLPGKNFAYLLTLDSSGLTGYNNCKLADVVAQYGQPSKRIVIAGNQRSPQELLLIYEGGTNQRHMSERVFSQKVQAPLLPLDLSTLPNRGCAAPTIVNIVAHEDDDVLFLSPDLIHNIRAGYCVRTVYITAGDAGLSSSYYKNRARGSEAAYSKMLDSTDTWVEQNLKLSQSQIVTIANLKNNPTVSLIFMNLPDGEPNGRGFKASRNESLGGLTFGYQNTIAALDKVSMYTKDQLEKGLEDILNAYRPIEVNTQANQSDPKAPDHSDHMATGRLVAQAFNYYLADNTAGLDVPILNFYQGYPSQLRPANVFGTDLQAKTDAFFAYAAYDNAVCHNILECDKKATYGSYLKRQYKLKP